MMRQYKDSGIEWIGKIPETWEVSRMKYLGAYINGYAFKPEDLSGSNDSPNYYKGIIDDKFLVHKGDILISWAATLDAFVWEKGEGWLNQHIFKADVYPNTNKKFFYWLAKMAMLNMNNDNKHGIFMQHVTTGTFNNFCVAFPPVSDQQRIADYLDEKCGEIDSLIGLQEQMIEKLKAYKQSVITEAVTKGLDPNAKLVPSGIDWIGEIPEGWLITDIKNMCISITDGSHFSPERQSEGMPYITAGDIRGKGIDYNNAMRIRKEDYNTLESQGCRPHKGDVLMVKDGATTGRVGMMTDNEECVLLSSVAMLTPLPNVDSNYLMYLIQSNVIQAQIQLFMAGSAMPRVTLKKINSLKGLLIPLNNQKEIATYLDEKCADIDRLISLKQQKIESLKDYKKSVIYEAVTGKTEIV